MIAVVRCDVDERDVLLGEADVVGYGHGSGGTTIVYRCPTCGGLVDLRAGLARGDHRSSTPRRRSLIL